MKKIIALVLSWIVVICCMVTVASAAGGRVAVNAGDELWGWGNNSSYTSGIAMPELSTDLDADGDGVVSYTYTGQIYAEGGYSNPKGNGVVPTNGIKISYCVKENEYSEVTSFDLTGMNYCCFELYVSDASRLQGKKFCFELTSSGHSDEEERCWKMPIESYVGGELVDGWNTVAVALDSYTMINKGDCVWTAWDFMRIYNLDAIDAGEGLTLAFKNLYFVDALPTAAPETPDEPSTDTPADDTPADDTPADDMPTDDMPTDDMPTDDTPAKDDTATGDNDVATGGDDAATGGEDTTTGGDDTATGDKAAPSENGGDITLYLIIGGAALLVVIVVVVVVVAKKKKK